MSLGLFSLGSVSNGDTYESETSLTIASSTHSQSSDSCNVTTVYKRSQFTVTSNPAYSIGSTSHSNFVLEVLTADIPAGFLDGSDTSPQDGGANIRAYIDDASDELNRIALKVVDCDTVANTGQFKVLVPSWTNSTANEIIFVSGDPSDTQPAASAPYGSDEVDAFDPDLVPPADPSDLKTTYDNMDSVADFITAGALTYEYFGQDTDLVIAGCDHNQAAESLTLQEVGISNINSATHGHSAGSLVLEVFEGLAINSGSHGLISDNITLDVLLVVAESTQAHTADGLTLTQNQLLQLAENTHNHLADEPWVRVPPEAIEARRLKVILENRQLTIR